jgi:hypothetical protein
MRQQPDESFRPGLKGLLLRHPVVQGQMTAVVPGLPWICADVGLQLRQSLPESPHAPVYTPLTPAGCWNLCRQRPMTCESWPYSPRMDAMPEESDAHM